MSTTASGLPPVGGEAVLSTVMVVREESLDLYGFATPGERTLFEAFTTVSGVGPRLALAICAVGEPDDLRLAIARGDSARLQTWRAASASGPPSGWCWSCATGSAPFPGFAGIDVVAPSAADQHLSARDGLVALGFKAEEADAALADAPAGLDAKGLVRHGLAALRRR